MEKIIPLAYAVGVWIVGTGLVKALELNSDTCDSIQVSSLAFKGVMSLLAGCFW